MRAFIVANGIIGAGEHYGDWVQPGDLVIAADGGAQVAAALGLRPDVVIGDMDSIDPEARERLEQQVVLITHPRRKDETDTELALRYAIEHGASEIILLGALGGRIDHTLANVLLLGLPVLEGVQARIVAGNTEVWLVRHVVRIAGVAGDIVTLLPLGGAVHGVTTEGLEWELTDATLEFGAARGVSNVMMRSTAQVTVRDGVLLVIHVCGAKEGGEMVSGAKEEATELTEVFVSQGHLGAHVAKSKLEAAGIPAILKYDSASLIFGLTVDGIGQVRVLVPAHLAAEAEVVLEEAPLEESDTAEGDPGANTGPEEEQPCQLR